MLTLLWSNATTSHTAQIPNTANPASTSEELMEKFFDEGKLSDMGTHDELIAQKGRYYRLYTGNFAENS